MGLGTQIVCTANILPHFDELLGRLPLGVPDGARASVGFENGQSRAKPLKRYPMAMRLRLVTATASAITHGEGGWLPLSPPPPPLSPVPTLRLRSGTTVEL